MFNERSVAVSKNVPRFFFNWKYLNVPPLLSLLSRWKSLKRQLLSMRSHSDSKGVELKRPNDSIYSFPCPDCMCRSNRTDDLRSSLATWSTHRIWWVFHVTYDFVSMPCCWLYFWYYDCFIFFPFPSGGRAYTNFRGSKRILLKVSLIWLYIWIEFQGSGIFFCTWCQFRTEWQPFSFAGISSRTLTDGFTYEWAPAVSNKLMIKEPKWHTRVPSHPACTLTWWSTIFMC